MSKANQYLNKVSLKNNDEAISPVIGTILMVAVTVILAAVIAAFVFGFTGNMPKAPKLAYIDVQRDAKGVTFNNVQAMVSLSDVSIVVDGLSTPLTLTGTTDGVDCYMPGEVTAIATPKDGDINTVLSQLGGKVVVGLDASSKAVIPANTHISIYASIDGQPVQVIEEMSI